MPNGVDNPNHISIVVAPSDPSPSSHDFLRFDKNVCVTDEAGESTACRIAVAFGLERADDGEWRITPLSPGCVCIYFPAIKETSNLRFHVHAPFASTVARDSVRACEANDGLRDHLAALIAESMMDIRRRGHLTVPFLAVLPNDSDSVRDFYRPIIERLIETFTDQPLLPMKRGGHAAAAGVYRADRRALSDVIDDRDLAILLGKENTRPLWIANPSQRNQGEDLFLRMLNIEPWEIDDLVECLSAQSDEQGRWIGGRPPEWHQRLYALLDEHLSRRRYRHYMYDQTESAFSELRIVLCADRTCPNREGVLLSRFVRERRRFSARGQTSLFIREGRAATGSGASLPEERRREGSR